MIRNGRAGSTEIASPGAGCGPRSGPVRLTVRWWRPRPRPGRPPARQARRQPGPLSLIARDSPPARGTSAGSGQDDIAGPAVPGWAGARAEGPQPRSAVKGRAGLGADLVLGDALGAARAGPARPR